MTPNFIFFGVCRPGLGVNIQIFWILLVNSVRQALGLSEFSIRNRILIATKAGRDILIISVTRMKFTKSISMSEWFLKSASVMVLIVDQSWKCVSMLS